MFGTLATILKWLVLLPIFLAIVLVAVANDQSVTVHLNPFDTADPVLRLDLALYQVCFILFVLGVLIGGLVARSSQRRAQRRMRRQEEATSWRTRTEWPGRQQGGPAPPAQAAGYLPRPERG